LTIQPAGLLNTPHITDHYHERISFSSCHLSPPYLLWRGINFNGIIIFFLFHSSLGIHGVISIAHLVDRLNRPYHISYQTEVNQHFQEFLVGRGERTLITRGIALVLISLTFCALLTALRGAGMGWISV
jgi:hypothetical protein